MCREGLKQYEKNKVVSAIFFRIGENDMKTIAPLYFLVLRTKFKLLNTVRFDKELFNYMQYTKFISEKLSKDASLIKIPTVEFFKLISCN